ncbi:hypothetical protein PVAP13_1KG154705 [Panicum virgatum]|uniref:Uncharacterized protein n=1 Tax=Panicum virgatum TaxID=38727 RepID=A0A8T0X8F4_PANVG|nr:hypothetical protein PVAP13_1KG154705 [Panicum virgatum]
MRVLAGVPRRSSCKKAATRPGSDLPRTQKQEGLTLPALDSTDLQFFALEDGFLVFPLIACTGHRRRGRRGLRFHGGRGRRSSNGHPRHRSLGHWPAPAPPPGHQPGPSTPAAAASSSTSDSSERTGMATPSYIIGITDERNIVAPTPPTSGNANFGLQASPSTNVGDTTMAMHPCFIVGTRTARWGAPPFYKAGGPSTAASVASTPPASPAMSTDAFASTAPSPARLFGRVTAPDHRPSIRRGTWSPAALGLSSGH